MPRLRQPIITVCGAEELHEAKVQDLEHVGQPGLLRQHDVARLDIAVDQSHGVGFGQAAQTCRKR